MKKVRLNHVVTFLVVILGSMFLLYACNQQEHVAPADSPDASAMQIAEVLETLGESKVMFIGFQQGKPQYAIEEDGFVVGFALAELESQAEEGKAVCRDRNAIDFALCVKKYIEKTGGCVTIGYVGGTWVAVTIACPPELAD
ncbi:hypothetical protein FHS56_001401 [Thermonema lapsum]|uniref:Uncharacterized protein n=1 Tax=Thermonema lapsum TaxID=28195 RepID=A0A846MQG6_9BACT|nr:hypothetical protein [Thermonema lapsum]NIK73888.1 hypothetical protein [Thermonema lapsum]